MAKRRNDGTIKDSVFTKIRSWWLGRKLRKGIVPRGRTITPQEATKALAFGAQENALEIFGILSAKILRADGSVEKKGVLSIKKITTAFRDYIVDSLQDCTTYPMDVFRYHGSGTGTNAESNGDTALQTEVASRATGTRTEGGSANIFRTVGTISYSSTYAITEHGIFSAASSGTLMDRSVFSAINVGNGDSIQFTYDATFNAEA